MTLAELKNKKGHFFNLVENANGKNLGLRKFRHYRQHDNSLVFEMPDGSISHAGLNGVKFNGTENGFLLSLNERVLAKYEEVL